MPHNPESRLRLVQLNAWANTVDELPDASIDAFWRIEHMNHGGEPDPATGPRWNLRIIIGLAVFWALVITLISWLALR